MNNFIKVDVIKNVSLIQRQAINCNYIETYEGSMHANKRPVTKITLKSGKTIYADLPIADFEKLLETTYSKNILHG